MSFKKKRPQFVEDQPLHRSFRSIFKWGAPDRFKNPGTGFLNVIKSELSLLDDDFLHPINLGNTRIEDQEKTPFAPEIITAFKTIVGAENINSDTYSRLKYASGKSMEDILALRQNRIEQISDLVLHPRDKGDVEKIVALCHEHKIPLHVHGGGSSVTLGLSCPKGGATLVMSTHMNKLISFNETNHTVTVEPGMMGPDYERLLNDAPDTLCAKQRYPGGHFPGGRASLHPFTEMPVIW
jgi:alkyldihydroxyacetonephosphate synthase